jgi:hypothetical protein
MNPNVKVRNIPGINIPEHDHVDLQDRIGTTNNLNSVTYRIGGASGQIVSKLWFTYIGGTPTTNNAEIATYYRTDS